MTNIFENKYSWRTLDLLENSAAFTLFCVILATGLSNLAFITFLIQFVESFFFFNRSWMLDFLKCFCCVYWDDCAALSSVLWMPCIMKTDLYVANHPCIPGISLTWSCVLTFLIVCWIQFVSIHENFCIFVHQGHGSTFFLLCPCLFCF